MKNIREIIKIAKPLHHLLWISAGLIVITSLLQLVAPILSKFIIDEITKQVTEQNGDLNTLIILIASSFAIGIIASALTAASNRFGDKISAKLRKYLTEKFYDHILGLPQKFFDSQISGKIANQLARGIESIRNFSNTATNFILPTFLQSFFTVIVLLYYNVYVGLFVAALFPIYYFLTTLSTKKWGDYEEKKNAIADKNGGRIQEVLANIKLVKSFTNENREFSLVSKNLDNMNDLYDIQSNRFHKIDFLRNFSLQVILVLVSVVVFISTFNGDLSIGEMVLIIQLVNQARRPLFAMSFILTQVQNTESGSKEFIEIIKLKKVEFFERDDQEIFEIQNPKIEFKNVNFSYDKSDKVLNNLTFELGNNEKIGLVGHSGAGKSTIVNLILKFYNPEKGEIALNGHKYSDLTPNQIRENISLVLQDNELFSTTIRENVMYGSKDKNEDDLVDALKRANAYDFVMKFKNGIDTEIGERGLKLSGGQKQRIQIARAILKNSPILILDEATSNLDSVSEHNVQDALEDLMKNKLVLIIAHRFSTIQNVDRIIVLNKGQISDMGSPGELAKKDGIYKELLQYQIEGNKKLLEKFELY